MDYYKLSQAIKNGLLEADLEIRKRNKEERKEHNYKLEVGDYAIKHGISYFDALKIMDKKRNKK